MKRVAAIAVSIVVLGAVGAFGYAHHLARPRPLPASVLAAEEALAMEGLVALAHFNIEHAVDVEPLILGAPDEGALPDEGAGHEDSTRDLISSLEKEGVDIRRTFHQWLGALVSGDPSNGTVQVWIGEIPTERVRAALEASYVVDVDPLGDQLLLLSREDPDTCELAQLVALHMTPEALVLGEPGLVARVVQRLAAGAAAEVDLREWRSFREPRLVSASLLLPESLGEAISNPMLAMAAEPAMDAISPLSAVFVGGQLQVVPPGLAVKVRASSRDRDWPAAQAQRFEDWRSETLASYEEDLPSLSDLLGRLSVRTEGGQLDGDLLLNRDFADNFMQALVVEPMQLFFGGLGGEGTDSGSLASDAAPEEVLRDPGALPRIQERVDLSSLPTFVKPEYRGSEGVTPSGPFGIWVKALRVLPDEDDVFEIELAAESTPLPNLHLGFSVGDNSRLDLLVSQVRGSDGTDLLRDESCGAKRNDDGGSFSSGSSVDYRNDAWVQVDPNHTGSKTVRLRPGVELDEVDSIEGNVVLRMPTLVETVRVDAPFEGQVIERSGIRIRFDASSADEVHYTLSGDRERVLAAWGLNATGKHLEGAGTTAMGRVGLNEKVVVRHYMGEVAALEFKLVAEEEEKRFPFRIEDISPIPPEWAGDDSSLVEPQSRAAFRANTNRDSAELSKACADGGQFADFEAFRLCLRHAESWWGTEVNSRFELYSPDDPVVRENLSGLELAIEGFTVAAQEGGEKSSFIAASDSQFAELSPDFQYPYLKGDLTLQTQAEIRLKDKTIQGVRGHVIHRLPTRVHPLVLDVSKLGNEVLYDNGFYFRLVEVGEDGMHIRMRGDRSRIVQLLLRDAEGNRLEAGHARLEPLPEAPGEWLGIVHFGGEPAVLEVRYALDVDEHAFPFELALTH